MKSEYVNPFLDSVSHVLKEIANLESNRGSLSLKNDREPFRDVSIIFGVIGDLRGQIIYGFDESTAKSVVSRMMSGAEINEFNAMEESALGELGNIITGKASIAVETAGYSINFSPPTLIIAKNPYISSLRIPMMVAPFETEVGVIDLFIGLEKRTKK
jgi:chemotaxis protein CheX